MGQTIFPYQEKGKWGLIDTSLKVVLKPSFEEIIKVDEYKKLLFFSDTLKGKGIVQFNGDTLLKPSLDYVKFEHLNQSFYQVYNKNNKLALYDLKKKKFLSKFDFDRAERFINENLVQVFQNNACGMFNLTTQQLQLACLYESISSIFITHAFGSTNSETLYKVQKKGSYAIYNSALKTFSTDFIFQDVANGFQDNNISVLKGNLYALYSLTQKNYLSSYISTQSFEYLLDHMYLIHKNDGANLFDSKLKKEVLSKNYRVLRKVYDDRNYKKSEFVILGNDSVGVYSIPLKKIIIPLQHQNIRLEIIKAQPTTAASKEPATKGFFICDDATGSSYHYYATPKKYYYDLKGKLLPEESQELKESKDQLVTEEYGNYGTLEVPGVGYDEFASPKLVLKRTAAKEYLINYTSGRNPKPIQTILTDYDSILTVPDYFIQSKTIEKSRLRNFTNDTFLLGIKNHKYHLINHQGRLLCPIAFDSLDAQRQMGTLFYMRDLVLLYYQNGALGCILLRYPYNITEPQFKKIHGRQEAGGTVYGYPYLRVTLMNGVDCIINVQKAIIYHPSEKMRLIRH